MHLLKKYMDNSQINGCVAYCALEKDTIFGSYISLFLGNYIGIYWVIQW